MRPLLLALPLTLALLGPAAGPATGQTAEPLQVLEGRIIRSLAVHPADPARLLVGVKGSDPGSALVLESRDSGASWAALNGGRPLSPEASDVQSLGFGPGGVILAGTWTQGLFLSRDDGRSFSRDEAFPALDVRDIRLFTGPAPGLYAATGSQGVLRSDDGARSWRPLGPDKTYVWSLSISRPSEAALYAASPAKGVFGSIDGGESWYRLFGEDGAYAVDASDFGTDSFIVAGEKGLHISLGGQDWLSLPDLAGEKLSSVLGARGQPYLIGSWSGGVIVVGRDGALAERLLPDVPVVHLARAATDLLVGTWGQGLYIFLDWFPPL